MTEKEQERTFVELARRAGASLPPGNLTDSESPDFLIGTADGRPTGIEVTRFSRQLSRAEIAHQEARLHEMHRTRGGEARPRPPVAPEEVAAVIGRKEARLDAYREKADAVWLLIVFGAFRARSRGRVSGRVLKYPFETSFAGVVLYDVLEDRAWTLECAASLRVHVSYDQAAG